MVSNSDIRWFNLALKIAEESLCYDKHGCVLVRSGSVIALACNRQVKTHPVSTSFEKSSIHAEQRALIKVTNAKGATLYTARVHKENKISRPCRMCEQLINEYGIRRVVYNNGSGIIDKRI